MGREKKRGEKGRGGEENREEKGLHSRISCERWDRALLLKSEVTLSTHVSS